MAGPILWWPTIPAPTTFTGTNMMELSRRWGRPPALPITAKGRNKPTWALPPYGRNAAPFEVRRHLLRIRPPQHAPAAKLGRQDPPPRQPRQRPHHRLYFRKFRHSGMWGSPPPP